MIYTRFEKVFLGLCLLAFLGSATVAIWLAAGIR